MVREISQAYYNLSVILDVEQNLTMSLIFLDRAFLNSRNYLGPNHADTQ